MNQLNKISLYLVLCFSLFAPKVKGQDISGNYTIGSSAGADYTTITDAVAALKTGSIVGDASFTINAGTYNETVDLSSISNGDFTISFIGSDKATTIIHPLDSIVSSKSGVLIESMNYVTFKNFTLVMDDISDTEVAYGSLETKGISIENSTYIHIENVDFSLSIYGGEDGTELIGSSLAMNDVQNVSVDSCSFSGGIKHVWMDDFVDVEVTNNTFERGYDFVSAEMSEGVICNGLLIENNDFDTPSYKHSINVEGVWGVDSVENVEILSNKINYTSSTSYSMAIHVNYVSGVTIADNIITDGHDGIDLRFADGITLERNEVMVYEFPLHLQDAASPLMRNNIFNSSINTASHIWDCTDFSLLNNTLVGNSTAYVGTVGRALDFNGNSGTATIVNNIISSNYFDDYNLMMTACNWDELVMDNNVFSATPTTPIFVSGSVRLKGVTLPVGDYDLSGWQALTTTDANSQVFDPEFVSDTDLRIQNATDYRFGQELADVTDDIDGQLRLDIGIDVGADQYYYAATEMCGDFVIGSSASADFATINEAIANLKVVDITCDVTFIIEAGTYNETISLQSIHNDGNYTVSFIGEDKATTIIHPLDSVVSSKSGILIEDMYNVTFKNLTLVMDDISDAKVDYLSDETRGFSVIECTNLTLDNISFTSSGLLMTDGQEFIASAISIWDSQNVQIDSCSFSGASIPIWLDNFDGVEITNSEFNQSYYHIRNIQSTGSIGNDLLIEGNQFHDTYFRSVNLEGDATSESTYTTNVSIQNNVINYETPTNYQRCIDVQNLNEPIISGNTITNSKNGLYISDCLGPIVEKNEINVRDVALYMAGASSSTIRNNLLNSEGEFNTENTYLEYNTDMTFVNNTVNSLADNTLIHFTTLDGVGNISNNIFSSPTETYGLVSILSCEFTSLIMDHNLYDVDPTITFEVGTINSIGGVALTMGDYDLSGWQALSSMDANSQVFQPTFVSATDLRIQNATDYRFGMALTDVTEDIDGDVRPETGIDVGADQYYAISDMCGDYTIGTSGAADFTTITEAINTLKSATISCDVTLALEAETFNETVDFSGLSNGDYTITFKGTNKATTIIHPLDSIESSKSGMFISGNQNLILRDFTFEMDDISDTKVAYNGNETKGIAITASNNIEFTNLSLTSSLYGGTGTEYVASSLSLIDVQNINIDSSAFNGAAMHVWLEEYNQVDITANEFDQAYFHIYNLFKTGAAASSDLLIAENNFNDPYTAIYLAGDDLSVDNNTSGVIIRDNTIAVTGSTADQIAVELLSLNSPVISGNTIIGGYHGLNDEACINSLYESNEIRVSYIALQLYETTSPLVTNNILYSQSYNTTDISKASDVSLINNTFHREASGENVVKTDLLGGTATIVNNIFSGNGITGGLLLFAGNSLDELIVDNNLYEPTAAFAFDIGNLNYIGSTEIPFGDYSLAEWQTLTSLDRNSQSFTPSFVSTTDLHITNAADYRFGAYQEDVTTDFDGDLRVESVGIDVGADQYCETYDETVDIEACASYFFDGVELTASGQYFGAFLTASSCDSLVTLNLTILESSSSEELVAVCDSYEWNGIMYSSTGTYSEVFTNSVGCDSTATLNLTILESTSSEEVIASCESYDWNGTTYTTSGTYSDVFTNAAGCDSTATLNLTILEASSSGETVTVCESYDWNGVTYTASGIYEELFTNAAGCDSTATLNLTILEATSSEEVVESCESYEWNGTTYTSSGTYSEMFTNAAGCDSTAILNLTILETSSSEETVSACESYDWNGVTYSESGTYEELFTNAAGCDSTATLNLTILESTSSEEVVESCESYEWNGTTYTSSGTYSEMFTNAAGCDSTAVLNLAILETSSSEETVSACSSYDWNGMTYTTSGTYSEIFSGSGGCDSTATLNLIILESSVGEESVEVCGSYDWNGATYSTSGTYENILTNAAGCDSTATLHLTIYEEPSATIEINGIILFAPEEEGLTYQWYDCETDLSVEGETQRQFTPPREGSFYVEISNEHCTVTSLCYDSDGPLVTGIAENDLSIYPNPSAGWITLGGTTSDQAYEVVNLSGATVQKGVTTNQSLYLKVKPGVYFIRLGSGNEIQQLKVVRK